MALLVPTSTQFPSLLHDFPMLPKNKEGHLASSACRSPSVAQAFLYVFWDMPMCLLDCLWCTQTLSKCRAHIKQVGEIYSVCRGSLCCQTHAVVPWEAELAVAFDLSQSDVPIDRMQVLLRMVKPSSLLFLIRLPIQSERCELFEQRLR